MAYLLLGSFARDERYPDVAPELAAHVGWLFFAACVLLLVLAWTRAESIRRSVLALEDPRTYAVLRIGFGLFTLINFVNLLPYWRMLWSDEGIFDLAYAQERLGRSALRGWSPDEGFFDVWGVFNFLANKPSLFYFWGTPEAVVWHMVALIVVCLLYSAGVFSRVTGVLAWFLMSSVYNRNALYLEGTDTVYRCFWFILLFAKTGHAWSFDNWWRCRRLRKKGKLEDPDADASATASDEGETKAPKEPIYRLVPAWPRYLFMLQLAVLYLCTGAVKTGTVWLKGDALYYALNMDHFYRFEGATQYVSAIFATNLFRVMTWTTHWWERLFPFALLGVILGFGLKHRERAWYRAQDVWWRKWLGRTAWVGAYVLAYRITVLAVPYCLAMKGDQAQDPVPTLQWVHASFGIIGPAGIVVWYALGRWPFCLFRGSRSLGPLTRRFGWMRVPEVRIDQDFFRRWLFGRRIWITLGLIFHGFLFLFMNIGMFPLIMMMTYPAWVKGEEIASAGRRCLAWMKRRRLGKKFSTGSEHLFVEAQQPPHVPVRGRTVPDVLLLVYMVSGLYLIWAKIHKAGWLGEAGWWWVALGIVGATAFRFMRPRPRDLERSREGPALAYGSTGRALALFALCWHAGAVGLHLFPSYPLFSKWRTPARAVFSSWLSTTSTSQSWRMFAPNPPRSNSFMKTVVVDVNGDRWDIGDSAYEDRPNPWIINDRLRKMQRRMIGKGKWYLKYWSAYQCREWRLRGREEPVRVEISKIVTHIPVPEVVNIWQPTKFKGRTDHRSGAITGRAYDPRKLKALEVEVQKHDCSGDGELPIHMKERRGLPITDEDRVRAERAEQASARKLSSKRRTWEKRRDWGRWWSEPTAEKRGAGETARLNEGASRGQRGDRSNAADDDGE
jgi:hypothetical protein